MSLRTVVRQRRFELFYASLVLCGLSLAAGSLPAVLAAGGLTDVPAIPAIVVLAGLGLAVSSVWEGLHRDRADWEDEVGEHRLLVAIVIGAGGILAGSAAYWILAAS